MKAKYFLAVAHIEDHDADYFSFSTLAHAVSYIETEQLEQWALADFVHDMPESEYTFVK